TQTLVCIGDTTTLNVRVTDPDPIYTSIWKPGNYHGLKYKVAPLTNTTYTVVVTDSSGCKDSAYINISTTTGPIVSISVLPAKICWNSAPLTLTGTPSGGVFSGNGVAGGKFYPSYINSGLQIITYKYTSSCGITYAYDTLFVESKALPPDICYVTADTSSTFNSIIWQKNGFDTLAIDSVIIYRQNILNVYVPIGEVSVHAHTKFNDYTAQPLIEPYLYALGAIDSCTGDTTLSNINETVFLQSSVGTGHNVVNLNWNFYQGTPVIYYRIMRDDSGLGNWHAIDSVQGTINAFSDRNAPLNNGLRYMINTDWNVACTPSVIKHRNSNRYVFNTDNEAYSNMTYLFPTGIANMADNNSINIYPNPVNDAVSISFNNAFEGTVKITDVLGQTVYRTDISAEGGSVKKINVNMLSNGVYFITLEGNGKYYRTKIIKMQ
ncbi:MAG TPA: T9SS type A sorting domain-containing protein, partial [Bacteroidia bacterium]|nr:T9SS type A sorting domain-containing protein [Bacteroidia bacterium]